MIDRLSYTLLFLGALSPLCAAGQESTTSLVVDLPHAELRDLVRGYGGKSFPRTLKATPLFHEWKRERYDFGVTVFCFSDHRTGNAPNLYNEDNPCFGVTLFTPWNILGADISVEYRYVQKNSVNGTSTSRGIGIGWPLVRGPLDLSGGFKYARIKYYDPGTLVRIRKPGTATGETVLPYLALSRGRITFTVEPLGARATIASFMISGKFEWP